jgi:hypothetical protein
VSVKDIASVLRAGRSGFESCQGQEFYYFFSPKTPEPARGPTQPPIELLLGFVPGGKAGGGGRDFDCAVSSSTEVKNDWNHTSPPPLSLHGVDGNNFTCLCVRFFPLYVCGLFNDAVSSPDCIAPSRRTRRDNLSFSDWVACLLALFQILSAYKSEACWILFISYDSLNKGLCDGN